MPCLTESEIASLPATTRVLELGCGLIKRWEHSVTVDFNPRSLADVIHDLNKLPYPFEDDHFDIVIAEHVLEHLDDLVGVVGELHRIIKPGGILKVEVPHFSSSDFFTDLTHKHAFSSRSFDYFINDTHLSQYKYSDIAFKKRQVFLTQDSAFDKGKKTLVTRLADRLRKAIGARLAKGDIAGYERNLAFILSIQRINFELEVIK